MKKVRIYRNICETTQDIINNFIQNEKIENFEIELSSSSHWNHNTDCSVNKAIIVLIYEVPQGFEVFCPIEKSS